MDTLHDSTNRLSLRRRIAVATGTGVLALTLAGCGNSESFAETPRGGVTTTITIPETGPIDTMSELLDVYCEDTLDEVELKKAVRLTTESSNKTSTGVQRGEDLFPYVDICGLAQE